MSEQLQSLLTEMEDKFQKSFSQVNFDEPASAGLNPESGSKQDDKLEENKILVDIDHDDQREIHELPINEGGYNNETQFVDQHQIQSSLQQDQQFEQHTPFREKQNYGDYMDGYEFKSPMDILEEEVEHSEGQIQSSYKQDQNPFYYKELTMKLEKALEKISSDKSITQLKKSSSGFFDRIQQFQAKRKKQIQRKKQQLEEKQIYSVKDRPFINSHSRAIVNQINNDPIYLRYDKIIQKKKIREQEYKRKKQEREQQQYEKYREEFEGYMKEVKQKFNVVRSPEEFYSEMMIWARNKEKNIESKNMQLKDQMKQVITFKPVINPKSAKIINKNKQPRIPVYQRQPKQRELAPDPNCTFKPKINKTNFHKKMSYYQSSA